jgi:hypothetical protein
MNSPVFPVDNKVYSIVLNSDDRVSGTANAAFFDAKFDNILPNDYALYNMSYLFNTSGNWYVDVSGSSLTTYSTIQINMALGTKVFRYDAGQNIPTSLLGYAVRQEVKNPPLPNQYFTSANDNLPLTISRPSQGGVLITLLNYDTGASMVKTNYAGVAQSDMGKWSIILYFTPIVESYITNIR